MLNEDQIKRLLDIANEACRKGQIFDARTIYKGVLATKKNFAPALIGLALSYAFVDKFEEAETMLKDVLTRNPEDQDAQVMLGLTYVLAKEVEKAHAMLDPIAENDSSNGRLAIDLLKAL